MPSASESPSIKYAVVAQGAYSRRGKGLCNKINDSECHEIGGTSEDVLLRESEWPLGLRRFQGWLCRRHAPNSAEEERRFCSRMTADPVCVGRSGNRSSLAAKPTPVRVGGEKRAGWVNAKQREVTDADNVDLQVLVGL